VKGAILARIYTRTRKVVTLFLAGEFFQGTLHRDITNNLAYSMSSFVDITSELAEGTERLDVFANHLLCYGLWVWTKPEVKILAKCACNKVAATLPTRIWFKMPAH